MSLDLTINKFSLANARELALYARMAYDEPPTIQDEDTDTQVLIRDIGDATIVAFRGTSSLRDFITDADCLRRKINWGELHCGFLDSYLGIKEKLCAALPVYGKPLIITGHSLGGALAMIAADYLSYAFRKVHSVYTFGSPRVGDKAFQSAYNSASVPGSPFSTLGNATFTVVHDCDIVPRIPGWLAGYRRPGRDEFISALNAKRIIEEPSLWFRLASDAVALTSAFIARRNPAFLDQLLTDHRINAYIGALDEIAMVEAPLSAISNS